MADLAAFLPRRILGLLPLAFGEGVPRSVVEGSILFCDVAGFTPMTEALSAVGREGPEELTRILNAYFARMIGIIHEEGGDVLRFGGDAMTVLFEGRCRRRAARAALAMMAAMDDFQSLETRAGRFQLSMKIGAAFGQVALGVVGDAECGWDYYAAGVPLDGSSEAEHRAAVGEIVCHPSFLSGVSDDLRVRVGGEGFGLLAGPAPDSGAEPPCDAPLPPGLLGSFIPPYLVERAGEGILGEHRGTCVVFLSFAGLDWDADDVHGRVASLYRHFATVAKRYGGIVNKLDMGDKGAKAILLFGAPNACENKEEMAVRATVEAIAPHPCLAGLDLKAGITSAPLFSAPVGSPSRREFTVMGDGINLAARLMVSAKSGQILVSKPVMEGAKGALAFAALPPIYVKGKKAAVPVFEPAGELGESPRALDEFLVERDAALDVLRGSLFGDQGLPVLVEGDAGLGKTALAELLLREGADRGIAGTLIPLAPYNVDRPFSAWKGVVRNLIGAARNDSHAALEARLDGALADEPQGFRPVLNPFLDLPEEPTPSLKALTPKEQKELAFAVVRRLLERGGKRILLLDGLQWADPLSLDLLSFLLQEHASAPWRMAAFSRPKADVPPPVRESVEPLQLSPLRPEGMRALLERKHGLTGISEKLLGWFQERSRGNPVVAAALVDTLSQEGLLLFGPDGRASVDEDRLSASVFPDTLEGLYLKQVDVLGARERLALQEASVVGYSVSVNLLGQVSGLSGEERASALKVLVEMDLLREDTRGSRPYMAFPDTMMKDAVYGSVPYAIKRAIHGKLLSYLEGDGGREAVKLWPVLAHHAENADEGERARFYHRLSGRDALKRFDNISALRHLEYVCRNLSPEPEDMEDTFSLLDIYGHLGRRENARELLSLVRPLDAGLRVGHRALLCNFIAREHWQAQEWDLAEASLDAGLSLYKAAGDITGEGKTYVNFVGGIYGPTGQMEKAGKCLEAALSLPRGQGQSVWRTTAAMNLGSVLRYSGKTEESHAAYLRAYREAIAGRLGPLKGMIAENLSVILADMGRFKEAAAWGRRAILSHDAFAMRTASLNARYNMSLALLATGKITQAEAILGDLSRLAHAWKNTQASGLASLGLAQAACLAGDLSKGLEQVSMALDAFRSVDNGRDYRFSLATAGNLYYAVGDPGRARSVWDEKDAWGFLSLRPADAAAVGPLERIERWFRGERPWGDDPERFLKDGEEASPEEALERLLWMCEGALAAGDRDLLSSYATRLTAAVGRWPYIEARLRALRIERLAQGNLSLQRQREAARLVRQCGGGIWGIRLECLTLDDAGRSAKKKRVLAIRGRLGFIRSRSPPWAWETIAAFPEIRAVLSGEVNSEK